MRRIYLIKMLFVVFDLILTPSSIENDYVDQFRYTQHVIMRGFIQDDMAIFNISHCLCLLSIDIDHYSCSPQVTDHTLQSIAEHCTGLQSLSLSYCLRITDVRIISMSTHCTGLQSLELTSIISISTHCIGLQSLNLEFCKITDTSIISISIHCTRLQSLNLRYCHEITDASIISISVHCTGLQSLNLDRCRKITDASIISISENCTRLKELNLHHTIITDASLIAIAKNCTGLQLLTTDDCDSLSCNVLRGYFDSLSKLRAVLLSIHPSF